jgi:hypothetical protein
MKFIHILLLFTNITISFSQKNELEYAYQINPLAELFIEEIIESQHNNFTLIQFTLIDKNETPIPFVKLTLRENEKVFNGITDFNGNCRFEIPESDYNLTVKSTEFEEFNLNLSILKNEHLHFFLTNIEIEDSIQILSKKPMSDSEIKSIKHCISRGKNHNDCVGDGIQLLIKL